MLVQSGAVAVNGALSTTGNLALAWKLQPSGAIAMSGTLATSGNVAFAWQIQPSTLPLAGTVGVTGNLTYVAPFGLAPTAPVAVGGTVAATGGFGVSGAVQPRADCAGVDRGRDRSDQESRLRGAVHVGADLGAGIVGSLGIAGDVPHTSQLVLAQTGALAISSALSVSGNVGFNWQLSALPARLRWQAPLRCQGNSPTAHLTP